MKTLETDPNKINLDLLGKYMSKLDLSNVPHHQRHRALMDHFLSIQEFSIKDRAIAEQIHHSRRMLQEKTDRENTLVVSSAVTAGLKDWIKTQASADESKDEVN